MSFHLRHTQTLTHMIVAKKKSYSKETVNKAILRRNSKRNKNIIKSSFKALLKMCAVILQTLIFVFLFRGFCLVTLYKILFFFFLISLVFLSLLLLLLSVCISTMFDVYIFLIQFTNHTIDNVNDTETVLIVPTRIWK